MPSSRLWKVLTVTLLAMRLCLASAKDSAEMRPALSKVKGRVRIGASQSPGLRSCIHKLNRGYYHAPTSAAETIFGNPTDSLGKALESIPNTQLALVTRVCWEELEKDLDRAYELKAHPIMSQPRAITEVVEKLGDDMGPAYRSWLDEYYSTHRFDPSNDPYYNIRVTNFLSDGTLGPLKELAESISQKIILEDMHPRIPVALPPPLPEDRKPQYILLESLISLCTREPALKDADLFNRDVIFAYLDLLDLSTRRIRAPERQVIWLRPSIMRKDELPIKRLFKDAIVILVMPNEISKTWELVLLKNLKERQPLIHHIALSTTSKGFKDTLKRIAEKVQKTLGGKRKPLVKSEVSRFAVERASQTAGALLYHAKMVFFNYNPINEISRVFVHEISDLSKIVAAELLTGLVFLPESLSRHYVLNKGYLIAGQVNETEETGANEEKGGEHGKERRRKELTPRTKRKNGSKSRQGDLPKRGHSIRHGPSPFPKDETPSAFPPKQSKTSRMSFERGKVYKQTARTPMPSKGKARGLDK